MSSKWNIVTTVNNHKVDISKEAILALMANYLATQTINSSINNNTTFKKLFDTYKKQILEFLILNEETNIDLVNEKWVKDYQKYKTEIIHNYLKIIEFEFSDGQAYKIYYLDLINLMCKKLNLKEDTKEFILQRNSFFKNENEVMLFLSSMNWNTAKKLISDIDKNTKITKNNKLYQKEWPIIEKIIKKVS